MAPETRVTLPLVPLRDLVVLPHMVASLSVGRARSLAAVEAALAGDRRLILAMQRAADVDLPGLEDLQPVGVIAEILQTFKQQDGSTRVLLEGRTRVFMRGLAEEGGALRAEASPVESAAPESTPEIVSLERLLREQITELLSFDKKLPSEAALALETVTTPDHLTDLAAAYMLPKATDRQAILETLALPERMESLSIKIARLVEEHRLDHEIHQKVRAKMDRVQRDYYLKEKLRALQTELGEGDEKAQEAADYRAAIAKAKLPKEAAERAEKELARLLRMSNHSAEAGVIRAYLDTLIALPWSKRTRDRLDLAHAEAVLDADHCGLQKVKDRLLEFLAVRALRKGQPATILCLVGPPGVGKTSLARSIATALGRKFVRASLGGVHDEAEIRGHRRTYVGAMPGRILSALKQAGTKNPVFLLDELDKLGRDQRSNPSAAMLEVLDPEQNATFSDHYVETPFDLSEVLFIATANSTAGIPHALLDRLEVIRLSGYTESEKVAIAHEHLLPKTLEKHGLKEGQLDLSDETLRALIRGWTREAGVRQLERQLAALSRKVARSIVSGKDLPRPQADNLDALLGPKPHRLPPHHRSPEVGTVHGLAWTEAGGKLMGIEIACLKGKGHLTLTGQLGDVMKESAQAAYTFVKAHAEELGIEDGHWKQVDLHLHVPQGAIPKDGPSAGVAIAVAIASALSGRPVRSDVAMTGEVTLRGRVLTVGGIKEKVLAAYHAELSTVLLPIGNEADLEDIPDEVKAAVEFKLIERLEEAMAILLLPALEARVPKAIEEVVEPLPAEAIPKA